MAKKGKFRGARQTPKRLEQDILERSREMCRNPEMLRPKCAGGCRKCHFDKTFALISRLGPIKDDAAALNKAACKGGDDIYKACAAMMSLGAAGTIPYMTSARIGGEVVPFAVRGRVGNDKLIAAQHFDDPKMRLFLYNKLAKKRKLHIYSFEDTIICSDRPNMPESYLMDTFWETPYEFPDDGVSCGHDVEGVLVIRIDPLDEIRICRNCAKDVPTLGHIISRMIAPDPLEGISVYVDHKYSRDESGGRDPITGELLRRYALGGVTDKALISTVLKDKLNELRENDAATYIIAHKNYGSDLERFLGELKGTDLEKEALRKFLSSNIFPVVIRSDRASEALGALWEDEYRGIITAMTSADIAEKMGDVSKMNPSQMITNAHNMFISEDIVARLPVFVRPGVVAKAADRFAKAVKVGGETLLRKEIESAGVKDYKSRSIARAFMMSVSSNTSAGWKFSAEEEDFARYLVPFVKDLTDSEGEAYRNAMNTLLTASGSGESV
jgi:hypothetical protein